MFKPKTAKECREWLKKNCIRGKTNNEYKITTYLVAKYLGLDKMEMYAFIRGSISWPLTIISKFIDEWESGILYVHFSETNKKIKYIKRRSKPVRMTKVSISLEKGTPALLINLNKPQQSKEIVSKFGDIFGKRGM